MPSVVFGLWGIKVLAPMVLPLYTWLSDNVGSIPLFAGPRLRHRPHHLHGVGVSVLIATGLILFVITFAVNAVARVVINSRKASSGAN